MYICEVIFTKMNFITERILAILEDKGLTPSSFADTIGIQRSSMSHILSGRNKPSLDVIHKILITFPDIQSDWLLTGKGPMKQLNLFGEPQKTDPEEERKLLRKELEKKEEILAKAEVSAEIVSGLLFSENTPPASTEPYYNNNSKSTSSVDAFFDSLFENPDFFKDQQEDVREKRAESKIKDKGKPASGPAPKLTETSNTEPEEQPQLSKTIVSIENQTIPNADTIENVENTEIASIQETETESLTSVIEPVISNELQQETDPEIITNALSEPFIEESAPVQPEDEEVPAVSTLAESESESNNILNEEDAPVHDTAPLPQETEQTHNHIKEAKEVIMITEPIREVENSAKSNLTVTTPEPAFQPAAEKPVQKEKKVKKIVIFYDDGTFSAHSPE
jgi:transcriptional regulator with XRE-family HTH domain